MTQNTRAPRRVGERLHEHAQRAIGGALPQIGEVAREDERLGPHPGCLDALDGPPQVGLGVDAVVEPAARVSKVCVADVEQHPVGSRVLCLAEGHARNVTDMFRERGVNRPGIP